MPAHQDGSLAAIPRSNSLDNRCMFFARRPGVDNAVMQIELCEPMMAMQTMDRLIQKAIVRFAAYGMIELKRG